MDTENSDLGQDMVLAEEAFTLVVLQKNSYRQAAKMIGEKFAPVTVSHTRVGRLVRAYKKYLADERRDETVDQKRAAFDAELEEIKALALDTYKGAKGKPLTQVAALNTLVATLAHQRAVQGLDMPKEVRADIDQDVRITWGEDV